MAKNPTPRSSSNVAAQATSRVTPRRTSRVTSQWDKPDDSRTPAPGLYLTATPIGNLGDLTFRARDLLATADLIVCEDTRVTRKLLTAYGIATPTTSYHDHNAAKVRPRLLHRLAAGDVLALVSDAGTPLISDPGYRLVRDAVAAGIMVTALPGASAVLAGLIVAGLPTDRIFYLGFLPTKPGARRRVLDEVEAVDATLVVLEAPRRLAAALADMAARLGPRLAAVARELTKLHEEVRRGPLDQLAAYYAEAGPPKGEVVVVIGPPTGERAVAIDAALAEAMRSMSLSEAVATVAGDTGAARRRVYRRALELAGKTPSDDARDGAAGSDARD